MSKWTIAPGLLEEMRLIDEGKHNVKEDHGMLHVAAEWQGKAQMYARECLRLYDAGKETKPKSVVEILEEVDANSASGISFLEERRRLRASLAEAVEWIDRSVRVSPYDFQTIFKKDVDGHLKSILTILKGKKTREIPG